MTIINKEIKKRSIKKQQIIFNIKALALSLPFVLSACGGGSAPIPITPQVPAAPTPTPAPTPPPIQVSEFETTEFRLSTGLGDTNVLAAYEAGITGEGVIVGIADTGLDINHVDFQGNVHPASKNFVENGAMIDPNGHGTGLAGIIGALKNDIYTHGIAYESTILALRVCDGSSGPSCTAAGDPDDTIATDRVIESIDHAIANGAKIVNFSLGLGETDFRDQTQKDEFRAALQRGVDAGLLLVWAAGNGYAANPQQLITTWAMEDSLRNGVLLVGSHDRDFVVYDRSNRAGNGQDVYLVAPAEVRTSLAGGSTFITSNGTSHAAPHVSGAAALLFQLFPNLTGQEVGEILLLSARDYGTVGVDEIFGHGVLDIRQAMQPIGQQTTAMVGINGTEFIPLKGGRVFVPTVFGDAFKKVGSLTNVMMLDDYKRSYSIDLTDQFILQQSFSPRLNEVLTNNQYVGSGLKVGNGGFSFTAKNKYNLSATVLAAMPSFYQSIERMDLISGSFFFSPAKGTEVRLGVGGNSFIAEFSQQNKAYSPLRLSDYVAQYGAFNPATNDQISFKAKQDISKNSSLSFAASFMRSDKTVLNITNGLNKPKSNALKASYLHYFQDVSLAVSAGYLGEENQILGSKSYGVLSLGSGATSTFMMMEAEYYVHNDIRFSAEIMAGATKIKGPTQSLFTDINNVLTTSWRVGFDVDSTFVDGDRLSLAISQPLRVMSGELTTRLATSRNYVTNEYGFSNTQYDLTPSGHEIDLEAGYRLLSKNGSTYNFGALYQRQPGHIAGQMSIFSVFAKVSQSF